MKRFLHTFSFIALTTILSLPFGKNGDGLLFAQDNVGIGTNTPDASAILELQTTNKGMLAPRMTTAQRISIASPANALLVYDTNFDCFFYFTTASGWISLCQLSGPTGPTGAAGANGATGINGTNGINCWDLNGNGANDPAEDINIDGLWDALDCAGAAGPTGPAGANGATGANGNNGINCWDLDGDGINDPIEDANSDGVWDAADCVVGSPGPTGPTGSNGTNGVNGATGPTGAPGTNGTNGTNGATGPTGPAGTNGTNGINGTNGTNGATGATGPTGPGISGSSLYYSQTTTLFGCATTLKTLVVTTAAGDEIFIHGEADYNKTGSTAYFALGLYRNGVEIHEVAAASPVGADNSVHIQWVDTPGAGVWTYTIRWTVGAGSATFYGSGLRVIVFPP